MSALVQETTQRVVAYGDTLRLSFVGPGTHRDEPLEFSVEPTPGNDRTWSALLLGKRAGDTIDLPEKCGDIVHAVIEEIARP